MIDEGDPAPDFDLPRPGADGDPTYRLSAAAREAPVVLCFFGPADADRAAPVLRDIAGVDWASVTDRLSVFGVGVDEPDAVAALAADLDLPFPLLADPDGFFAERYGALEEAGDGWRLRLTLALVDRDCRIRYLWRSEGGEPSLPLDEVTSRLGSL